MTDGCVDKWLSTGDGSEVMLCCFSRQCAESMILSLSQSVPCRIALSTIVSSCGPTFTHVEVAGDLEVRSAEVVTVLVEEDVGAALEAEVVAILEDEEARATSNKDVCLA